MDEKVRHIPNCLVQKEGLKQLIEHNKNYHCVISSSFDTNMVRENQEVYIRRRKLHNRFLAELEAHFFAVSLRGTWEDEKKELHKEEGFFVVSEILYRKRDSYFFDNLELGPLEKKELGDIEKLEETEKIFIELGKKYNHDTFCVFPRHSIGGVEKAYLVDVRSGERVFFDVGNFSLGDIFSRIRKRVYTDKEKWALNYVHYKPYGKYKLFERQRRIDCPLDKLKVSLYGLSIKGWLEVGNGQLKFHWRSDEYYEQKRNEVYVVMYSSRKRLKKVAEKSVNMLFEKIQRKDQILVTQQPDKYKFFQVRFVFTLKTDLDESTVDEIKERYVTEYVNKDRIEVFNVKDHPYDVKDFDFFVEKAMTIIAKDIDQYLSSLGNKPVDFIPFPFVKDGEGFVTFTDHGTKGSVRMREDCNRDWKEKVLIFETQLEDRS